MSKQSFRGFPIAGNTHVPGTASQRLRRTIPATNSGEFVARNLYPFCKLKDLPSRQTPSSEERKQHHEAIGSDKALQRQALHDCFALSEFLKRVVAAALFLPVGRNRAT